MGKKRIRVVIVLCLALFTLVKCTSKEDYIFKYKIIDNKEAVSSCFIKCKLDSGKVFSVDLKYSYEMTYDLEVKHTVILSKFSDEKVISEKIGGNDKPGVRLIGNGVATVFQENINETGYYGVEIQTTTRGDFSEFTGEYVAYLR